MSQTLIKTINKKSNLRFFRITTAILITTLLFLYIFQTSTMAKRNSLVESYEFEIEQIYEQNKDLEITFSQKNSLKNSENLLKDLNFEKVTKIDYIRILETAVAAK